MLLTIRVPLTMSDCVRHQVMSASNFSLKRVALHVICLLRRPEKAAFFFAGIQREFAFLMQWILASFPPFLGHDMLVTDLPRLVVVNHGEEIVGRSARSV
jgi:hypothetical protein